MPLDMCELRTNTRLRACMIHARLSMRSSPNGHWNWRTVHVLTVPTSRVRSGPSMRMLGPDSKRAHVGLTKLCLHKREDRFSREVRQKIFLHHFENK